MDNTGENRYGLLTGTGLKLIAMASMVLDHLGDNFFPGAVWMRALGRIAMPVFAFCVAEGFIHTHDRMRYFRRLLLFGVLSEVPFDLVTAGKVLEFSHQNIMFTFAWAALGLMCFEGILRRGGTRARYWLAGAVLLGFLASSLVLGLDYNMLALGLIFLFYILRSGALWVRTGAAAAFHVLLRNMGIYWFGLLGFVPILLYNGQRGKGLKWLFYLFYPGHLLLIWLVRQFV